MLVGSLASLLLERWKLSTPWNQCGNKEGCRQCSHAEHPRHRQAMPFKGDIPGTDSPFDGQDSGGLFDIAVYLGFCSPSGLQEVE